MSAEPKAGDIRFSDSGEIEAFDGTEWGPYRRMLDQSGGVLGVLRDSEPGAESGE
jgi:hypothetical protein